MKEMSNNKKENTVTYKKTDEGWDETITYDEKGNMLTYRNSNDD